MAKVSYRLYLVLIGAIRVVEGLAMIACLGFYYPGLEIRFLIWNFERKIRG